MKKLAIIISAVILASASTVVAAPAFAPIGKVTSTTRYSYSLVENSFTMESLAYSAQFPNYIPSSTQSLYGISISTNQAPAIGDVNLVTYRANEGNIACTFRFTYLGQQKFQAISLTFGNQCDVKNDTDLVLP